MFCLLIMYFRAATFIENRADQARSLIDDKYLNAAFSMYSVDLQQIDFIVESLSKHSKFSSIEIVDINGKTLAMRSNPPAERTLPFPQWLKSTLFSENKCKVHIDLYFSETYLGETANIRVGAIIAKLHPSITYQLLLETVLPSLIFLLLQLSVLTTMFIRLFRREIGEPLGKITEEIKHSWPLDKGSFKSIHVPKGHSKDEIGQIVRAYNRSQKASIKYFNLLKKLSNEAIVLSKTDILTGALNRRGILSEGDIICASQKPFIFAVIDIDSFEQFNDSFGYPSGDAMLKSYHSNLIKLMPKETCIGRISGGTFTLVIPQEVSNDDVMRDLNQLLYFESFDEKSQVSYVVTTSIGVYHSALMLPSTALNAQMLLHYGFIALQQAKISGSQNIKVFDFEMKQRNIKKQRDRTQLREVINSGCFKLAYQPKVEIATGKIIGCEVLLRLPGEGNKAPFHLITLAEKNGQIVTLGNMIFERAISEMSTLRQILPKEFSVSINVSPKQLPSSDFLKLLENVNTANQFPLNQVDLEITELTQFGDVADYNDGLTRCRELGCSITLDDFGTGFASMEALLKTGFNQIKIDKEFVGRICLDCESQKIVASIIYLANLLDIDVIAEGIENSDQEAWLKDHGIKLGQGYLYSKPVTFFELKELLVNSSSSLKEATIQG